jgi:hypothetical protein
MTPERDQRAVEIFQASSVHGLDARAAFLAQACAGDDELRREVEAMLADAQSGGSLSQPADDLAVLAELFRRIPAARAGGEDIAMTPNRYQWMVEIFQAASMGNSFCGAMIRENALPQYNALTYITGGGRFGAR